MAVEVLGRGTVGPAAAVGNPGLAAFRARYRAHSVPASYSGPAHFTLVATVCLATAAGCLAVLDAPAAWTWLTVPATYLAANLVEYHAHRGPMHHPVPGLGLVYRRHVHQHHRFFRASAIGTETPRDVCAVLFPLVMLGFFLGLIATPIGLAVLLLAGPNAAALYLATVALYYLSYECFHYFYHLPDRHWLVATGFLAGLRRYHRRHHDPRRMNQCNFNLTAPIADCLYRTARFGDAPASRRSRTVGASSR